MKPIRVLIADDHALIRAGLRSLLEGRAGIAVVAEAADGRQALELIGEHQPDVALLDILMPELNGLDVAARVAALHPHVRVLILSVNASEEYVLQALRAGAAGYLLKNVRPSELEEAVRAVAAGKTYLTPEVTPYVVAGYVQLAGKEAGAADRLTPRQRQVLRLIAEGDNTKAIARKLGLSPKTVEAHCAQLMAALDIHDIAGLVRYAIRVGIVSPEH